MAQLNFDASGVPPIGERVVIPEGWYMAMITNSEMRPTKTDSNQGFLALNFEVVDGEFKGQKLFKNINLYNNNQVAVDIAQKELSGICHATGIIQVTDSTQLHNIPHFVKINLREAGIGKDGKHYGESNEIVAFKGMAEHTQAISAPVSTPTPPPFSQQPPMQAATQPPAANVPPWQNNGQQAVPATTYAPQQTPPWQQQAAPSQQAPAGNAAPWANQAATQPPAANVPPWKK